MKDHVQLIDVTALALGAQVPAHRSIEGIARWLERDAGAYGETVPVYFTRRLWERLGGAVPDQRAYHEAAAAVFAAAKKTLAERIIAQNAWRGGLDADWGSERHRLWLIVDHGYSDGIAIGFGPGDFW